MGSVRIGCSGWNYQHWRDNDLEGFAVANASRLGQLLANPELAQ